MKVQIKTLVGKFGWCCEWGKFIRSNGFNPKPYMRDSAPKIRTLAEIEISEIPPTVYSLMLCNANGCDLQHSLGPIRDGYSMFFPVERKELECDLVLRGYGSGDGYRIVDSIKVCIPVPGVKGDTQHCCLCLDEMHLGFEINGIKESTEAKSLNGTQESKNHGETNDSKNLSGTNESENLTETAESKHPDEMGKEGTETEILRCGHKMHAKCLWQLFHTQDLVQSVDHPYCSHDSAIVPSDIICPVCKQTSL